MNGVNFFSQNNRDVIVRIFKHFEPKELGAISKVNKTLNKLASTDELWKPTTREKFPTYVLDLKDRVKEYRISDDLKKIVNDKNPPTREEIKKMREYLNSIKKPSAWKIAGAALLGFSGGRMLDDKPLDPRYPGTTPSVYLAEFGTCLVQNKVPPTHQSIQKRLASYQAFSRTLTDEPLKKLFYKTLPDVANSAYNACNTLFITYKVRIILAGSLLVSLSAWYIQATLTSKVSDKT